MSKMFSGRSILAAVILTAVLYSNGCSMVSYRQSGLYNTRIKSVCLKMFDNRTFRRNIEYTLTDAIAKQISSRTPYRIVRKEGLADSVLSGQIVSVMESSISTDRPTGRPLEKAVHLSVVVTWKDLNSGQILIDNETIEMTSTYSDYLNQTFDYATRVATNEMAGRIVEMMEIPW